MPLQHKISMMVEDSATAMAVAPWGRNVALAGKRGLHIVDLENVYDEPRWVRHLTSWEVADVQWSPNPARPYWVVSTSNQKGILWNLSRSSANAHEYILHGHQRAITDINFHNLKPDVLATVSIDCHCFVWDVRDSSSRPAAVFCDWDAAASQVKWNFKNEHVLATSHGSKMDIWDTRNGNRPVYSVVAHDAKINGLSFSRIHENEILSCSNDGTVKTWNYGPQGVHVQSSVVCDFPVAKARVLAFGDAMAIMPLRQGNNAIKFIKPPLPDTTVNLSPIFECEPSQKPMCEFLWRQTAAGSQGNNEFELLTLGKDNKLKVWETTSDFYEKIGYNYKGPMDERDVAVKNKLRQFKYVSYRDEPETPAANGKIDNILTSDLNLLVNELEADDYVRYLSNISNNLHGSSSAIDPCNLAEELGGLHHELDRWPSIRVEGADVSLGKLVFVVNSPVLHLISRNKDADIESYFASETDVRLHSDHHTSFLRITLKFKRDYPKSGPPSVSVEQNLGTGKSDRVLIEQYITYIAEKLCSWNEFCLHTIFDFLSGRSVTLQAASPGLPKPLENLIDMDSSLDGSELEDEVSSFEVDGSDLSVSEKGLLDQEPAQEVSDDNFQIATHANVPDQITCGAIWSPDGNLLVFLSAKSDPLPSEEFVYAKSNEEGLEEHYKLETDELNILFPITPEIPVIRTVVSQLSFPLSIPSKFELAGKYQITGKNAAEIAKVNTSVVEDYLQNMSFLTDEILTISNIWNIVSVIVSENDAYMNRKNIVGIDDIWGAHRANDWGFYLHSFGGSQLVQDIITYLEKRADIQMLAMISCLLPEDGEITTKREKQIKQVDDLIEEYDSPYDMFATGYSINTDLQFQVEVFTDPYGHSEKDYEIESSFNKDLLRRLAKYRDMYSSMLLSWGLPEKRVEMLKYNFKHDKNKKLEQYQTHKISFGRETTNVLMCTFCCRPLKSLQIEVCHMCHHVFHSTCSKLWFKNVANISSGYSGEEENCPSGCGCKCLKHI